MKHTQAGRLRTRQWTILVLCGCLGWFALTTGSGVYSGSLNSRTFLPLVSGANRSNPAACKLPEIANRGDVGEGFPRYESRLRSSGTVHAKVIFVDFSDAPAAQTPQQVYAIISPGAAEFYAAVSYGRMDYQLEPSFTWLRMSKPSTQYGWSNLSYDLHRTYIQEAVNLANPNVDFSGVDQIVVMANPAATAISNGPAFTGAPQFGGITADGTIIYNAVTSGNDLTGWGARWLNHEGGHTLGLVDLYAFAGDTHRFMGQSDSMGLISGHSPEYIAYHRWLLGWLDDSQIYCQQTASETVALRAIEQPGGIKAVMVQTGPSSLVVVESRRALGYDTAIPKAGALVYTVDSSVASGEGPVNVRSNSSDLSQAPLASGEQITVGKVTIKVIQSTPDGDTVQVTIAP